ncbi:MAG: hypothetical protein HUN04_17380 [Desulfobacter sp.]|nr:MAG: hypothetical protein HUN04_17380 [Desulfobacter sp.]
MKIQTSDMSALRAAAAPELPMKKSGPGFSTLLEDTLTQMNGARNGSQAESAPVEIGTITRETPTISQLLYKTPLKSKCWNIIYDKVNADKAFHKIRPGTRIMFDPATKELLWGKELDTYMAKKASPNQPAAWTRNENAHLPEFAENNTGAQLSKAVKSFIGRDYDAMDCYELVVGGLKELGVQYRGENGLGRHLVNQARAKGLPENHYLNGEGLVSESGRSVFKKTIFRVSNPQTQAEALMAEMENKLQEGQVLSFSMRNKGHTGVVSKSGNAWTFINSGEMDHNISGENGSKKVGEEDLKSEIENWFRLARETSQGLKITLGELNVNRLSMFRPGRIDGRV